MGRCVLPVQAQQTARQEPATPLCPVWELRTAASTAPVSPCRDDVNGLRAIEAIDVHASRAKLIDKLYFIYSTSNLMCFAIGNHLFHESHKDMTDKTDELKISSSSTDKHYQ